MNKTIFYLLSLVIFTGCKSWDSSMLMPKNDPLTPKLLTLERRIEDLSNTTVVANGDELILFTKEVENNLIDPYGDKYGYIALKKNIIKVNHGMGYLIPSAILLYVPTLFGFPCSNISYKVEVEIRIMDRDNKLISKYSAIGESRVKAAMYYGYSLSNAARKSYSDAILDAFNKIRPQIQLNAANINEKLRLAGKLKKFTE